MNATMIGPVYQNLPPTILLMTATPFLVTRIAIRGEYSATIVPRILLAVGTGSSQALFRSRPSRQHTINSYIILQHNRESFHVGCCDTRTHEGRGKCRTFRHLLFITIKGRRKSRAAVNRTTRRINGKSVQEREGYSSDDGTVSFLLLPILVILGDGAVECSVLHRNNE